jgi:hypothetical protein
VPQPVAANGDASLDEPAPLFLTAQTAASASIRPHGRTSVDSPTLQMQPRRTFTASRAQLPQFGVRAVALYLASAIMQGGTALKAFIAKQISEIARLCLKHRQTNKPSIEMRLQSTMPAKKQKARPRIALA